MHIDDHLEDRQAFEMALMRVRDRHQRTGVKAAFHQLLQEAEAELKQEHERLKARIAELPPESD